MNTLTRAALVAALLALVACAHRPPDNGFWRQATPHIKREIGR